jgi:hypothetical protein
MSRLTTASAAMQAEIAVCALRENVAGSRKLKAVK